MSFLICLNKRNVFPKSLFDIFLLLKRTKNIIIDISRMFAEEKKKILFEYVIITLKKIE